MPTTPRRSSSANASSARATRPACCRSPAKSSTWTWPAFDGAARHQLDAEPGRHQLEFLDRAWWAAAARRRGRGAPGAADARRRAAGRAGRVAHRVEGRGVGAGRCEPLGQVWRSARRQAFQRQDSAARRRRSRSANTSWSARACRASIIPDKVSGKYEHMHHVRCPACCTAASCCRAASAPMARARSRSTIDESSIEHIPGARRRAQGRFHRRGRGARMGRGQGRTGAQGDAGR